MKAGVCAVFIAHAVLTSLAAPESLSRLLTESDGDCSYNNLGRADCPGQALPWCENCALYNNECCVANYTCFKKNVSPHAHVQP